MSSDLKYGKPQEKQGKNKIGLSPEAEGVICALISGILFGTMPLPLFLSHWIAFDRTG